MPSREFVLFTVLMGTLLTGCMTQVRRDEMQIRERVFSIRDAIRAKEADGIVRWGTDDWSFTGPDGKSFDKLGYLVRVRGLFERTVSVDSLETTLDTIEIRGSTATIEISQLMERSERNEATGKVEHLRLRYRERHEWMKAADGWRVRSVRFIGIPERTLL